MEKFEALKNKDGKICILIVEDSATQAQKLQFLLEQENFAVHWADNGNKGLEFLETQLPVIIISDVLMPEMDGFKFCSIVKNDSRYKHIPVILLTTLSDPQDIIKGLESGADNFITKPYEKDYLLSRIEYILSNLKLRRGVAKRTSEMGLEIFFAGKKYYISSEKMQIVDLLFSTYEAVIQKNIELKRLNTELKNAADNIRVLKGLIPICANCKKVRNDDGFWEQVEVYVRDHSEADFSHSMCPACLAEFYPNVKLEEKKDSRD
jgi:two-component system cell cycle response regulator